MFASAEADIAAAAIAAYPREMCGFVVDGRFVQVANVAENQEACFQMPGDAWLKAKALGTIEAVVHSHPDGPAYPSLDDMNHQLSTAVPWGISVTDGYGALPTLWFGDGTSRPPLLRRGFRFGVNDCYSLIRDAYALGRDGLAAQGVTRAWPHEPAILPEFPREWDFWANPERDLYRQGFPQAGFRKLYADERPEVGDVALAQIGRAAVVINHAGILLHDGLLAHHLPANRPVDEGRLPDVSSAFRYRDFILQWLRFDP